MQLINETSKEAEQGLYRKESLKFQSMEKGSFGGI
jgi:hypothetical protein